MADKDAPETGAGYAHWDQKPALGRRGMILAVVIPVLIAAAGFGAVVLVSQGSETAATAIKVPTGEWIPGQPGGTTPIRGTLAADSRHCVYLESADGTDIWPVWPAGFRARLDDTGKVSLYDGKDHLVARDGEAVQASGTMTSPATYGGESCLPSDDDIVVVQSEVRRVG